jgi:DNA-binding CsgD family transcriptional regulator
MSHRTSRHDTAVETFHEHGGLTEREAEAFVYRELDRLTRGDAADQMDISESTLDTLHQRAKQKVRLPGIKRINRQYRKNTGYDEGTAWEVWFENSACLRYVWNTETESIHEQTITAVDPHSIYDDYDVDGSEDELAEYMLTTLEEYTQSYRDDWEAARKDWSPIFAAITGYN